MQATNANEYRQTKAASGINFLLGIWLIIAPFILAYSVQTRALWNSVVVGIVVLVLAAIRFFVPDRNTWLSGVNILLGLWLFVSSWVLGFSSTSVALWNNMVVGVLIILLAAWSLTSTRHVLQLHHAA